MSARRLKGPLGPQTVEARLEGERLTLRADGAPPRRFEAQALPDGSWMLREGELVRHVHVVRVGGTWWVHDGGRTHVLEEVLERGGEGAEGSLLAPMTGTVQELLVSCGQVVSKGEALLVLSAMKMQVEIKSPLDGTVTSLPHGVGDQVTGGEPVAVVEARGAEDSSPEPSP